MRRDVAIVLGLVVFLLLAAGVFMVMSGGEVPAPPPAAPDTEEAARTKGRVRQRDGTRSSRRSGGKPRGTAGSGGSATSGSGAASTGPGSKPISGRAGSEPAPPKPPKGEDPAPESVADETLGDAADPSLPPAKVEGVVLDGATGEPVANARILYAIVGEKGEESWFGATTMADGRFSAGGFKPEQLRSGTAEIRIGAVGYRTYIAPIGEATVEARLEAREDPPLPGVVVGNVLGADSQPYHGRIAIAGFDAFGDNMHQWTTTDEAGAFRLEGMPAGRWRLAPAGADRQVVLIPEDDSVHVSFELTGPPQDTEKVPDETRAVSIEGIPEDAAAGSAVRAELRARHYWRAAVRYGKAEFPHLPVGNWTFVLEQPGRPERTVTAAVATGDEPLVVTLGQ